MRFSNKQVENVLKALENDKYQWRTIKGISKETKLPRENVLVILNDLDQKVIKSKIPSVNGEDLYTTREHYLKKSSIIDQLGASIKNRGIL